MRVYVLSRAGLTVPSLYAKLSSSYISFNLTQQEREIQLNQSLVVILKLLFYCGSCCLFIMHRLHICCTYLSHEGNSRAQLQVPAHLKVCQTAVY